MAQEQTIEQLKAEIAALEAEKKRLVAEQQSEIVFKVSEKGAISVYGLSRRFPTTLYKSQWERLAPMLSELFKFIKANEALIEQRVMAEKVRKAVEKNTPKKDQ